MLDKNTAADVLTAALSHNGDFAEIFMENNEKNGLVMINGVVEKALWGVDYGCGIRVFNGINSIYVYTNDISRDNLLAMAKEAAAAGKNETKKTMVVPPAFHMLPIENRHTIVTLPAQGEKKTVVDKLRQAAESARAYDSDVTQTSAAFSGHTQDVLIINSDGLWAEDRRVRTRVVFESIASAGNEKQTGFYGPGAQKGFEFLDDLDMRQIGRDTAKTAVTMLRADFCPGGRMPVVIDNGFGGVIFHEACGHSLEATSVVTGASVFSKSMEKRIAAECITAIDDGGIEGEWGSLNIDDEGEKTRKNILIEKGILKSFLIDRMGGLRLNMPVTGSGRRESYKYAPTSRMTNTYIAPGTDKREEIMADTEYGLYARQMGGGSVNPATGDFNFAVVEGYLIRNGKIAEPVRGATLIGKGAETLLQIDRVSDELRLGQGMCGSVSGSVPVNVGQPVIRVSEMTVGGRK